MARLLVIEDSSFFLNLIRKGFEDETAVELVTATTLAEAQTHLAEDAEPFALALVDLRLPDANDGEAVDLTLDNGIPSVVFTSNFDEDIRTQFLDKGILDFVLKDNPSSLDYVLKLTARVIKNRSTTVLVVDDSTIALRMCSDLLQRYQLNVIEAASGAEALKILNDRDDIRMVLTDHEMPEMNGFELVTAIRREYSRDKLAVIGVSGAGGAPLSAMFIKHGANDFIAKPYLPEELYTRVALNLEILENIEALTNAATKDYLTGLFNRRSFFDVGNPIASTRRRSKFNCAVAMLDIDHFKAVNDTYGHDGGDAVLKAVAEVIQDHANRGGDLCARLGGEEFALMLEVENIDNVAPYFERLRAAIEARVVPFNETDVKVTASFGVVVSDEPDLEAMLTAADEHLYTAKNAGRNRVIIG